LEGTEYASKSELDYFCVDFGDAGIKFCHRRHKHVHDPCSFNGSNGRNPNGSLTVSGTTLFGMTATAGAGNYGNVFSINIDGFRPQTLHPFNMTMVVGLTVI